MIDDWTSAMMVLASEIDILENLSNDEIIDKFAEISRIRFYFSSVWIIISTIFIGLLLLHILLKFEYVMCFRKPWLRVKQYTFQ